MRVKLSKIVLPLLLVLVLGGFSLSLAASPGAGTSHADERPSDDVTAGHAMAATDAHGEAVSSDAHGAEGAHVTGKSITPAKLKDLFWRTVNFIALLIILIKFLAKPIGNALAGRQQQVIDELETLQEKRDAAERSYKEFESRLAGMEKEMEVVVQRAIAQAGAEKAKILEDAEKAAEDIKRQAEAAVQAEIVEAKRTLRDDIADQAAAMAEELIVKNLTPADQVKITEQYLDRVGTVQ
jgi:F-type H+-transporting ATPase subunit b